MNPSIDNKAFYKKMWKLALPIALQNLMLAAVAACDALMLGRVAQAEMTAVSLAAQIQFVQNMFLMAATSAGSILGAQYFGKGDLRTVRELFSLILRVCGLIALVTFAACEFAPGLLMRMFTHDAELIELGSVYLRIAGWSYLMSGISQSFLTVMKFTDHVRASALISSGTVLLNIALNAVLIFGLFGVPAMSFRGAAVATTVSRAAELATCVAVTLIGGYVLPDRKSLLRGRRELSADFRRQCLPLLGASLLWGVGFTGYTAVIGHMDSDAAAANSVASVIRDLTCCACIGVGGAAAIMVGNELGAGRLELGKAYGIKLRNISWLIGFGSATVLLALTPLVVRFVRLTDTARGYLTGMMIIMAVYMIGRSVTTVTINGVLTGGGDTLFDLYSLAVAMWGVALPLAVLGAFVFRWPVLAVYACTCLDEVGKLPWVMLHFRKYKWVKDLTRPE